MLVYIGSIVPIYSIYLLQVFFSSTNQNTYQPMISEINSLWIASCWSKLSKALWFMCEMAQIWNDKAATYLLSHNRLFGWNSKLHLNISKNNCNVRQIQTPGLHSLVLHLNPRGFSAHFQEAKLFMLSFNSYFGHYCWCFKLEHYL